MMWLLVFMGSFAFTDAMPRSRMPLLKKGPLAWEMAKERPTSGRARGGVNRLHVHAVDDSTNKAYAKEVRIFLNHVRSEALPFVTANQRDVTMADYLSDLCYIHQVGAQKGSLLFSGFLSIFPEHKGHMPETCRAMASWQRLALGGEGGPLASTTIAAVALDMTRRGHLLEALALWLSEDCYLREQDWHQLLGSDVFTDGATTAIVMGVRERGQKVKTGSNQGVSLDRAFVADALNAVVASIGPGESVFPFDPVQYRRVWWDTLRRLGLEFCGPPHNVRHSGPSADIGSGRRDLEQVRRRGRWASMNSVQRYTKDFRLVEHKSKVPAALTTEGTHFISDPRRQWVAAIAASPLANSDLAAILVKALQSRSANLCKGAPRLVISTASAAQNKPKPR